MYFCNCYSKSLLVVFVYLLASTQWALCKPEAWVFDTGADEVSVNINIEGDENIVREIDVSVNGGIAEDCDCTDCDCEGSAATVKSTSESTPAQELIASIRNCDDLYDNGFSTDGVYTIFTGERFVEVYCEFQVGENNWMVIQRRINGEVDFYLDWESYVNGFGDVEGEFWLGLQAMHEITTSGSYRLRVDLEDWFAEIRYAEYGSFSVANSTENYALNVDEYSGIAGNSLLYHNGWPFSTYDRDNDGSSSNCAIRYQGGWWFNACLNANLNGRYRDFGPGDINGVLWIHFRNSYSLKEASMRIRPN